MIWPLPVYVSALLLAGACAVAVAVASWRRRATPGAAEFTWLMLAVAVWCLGYAAEVATPDLAGEFFWEKIQYIGIVSIPVWWLAFAMRYSRQENRLAQGCVWPLAVAPALSLSLVWTNELHGLFYASMWTDTAANIPVLNMTPGPGFILEEAYSYSLLLVGVAILLRRIFTTIAPYREQTAIVLLAATIPMLTGLADTLGLSPLGSMDATPFVFALSGALVGWALFRHHFLDLTPLARHAVVEAMADAVLLIDLDGRLMDLNPAARRLIGAQEAEVIGRPARQVLSAWPELVERYRTVTAAHDKISVGQGAEQRWYDLRLSPLYVRGSELAARILVLRDITEREQAGRRLAAIHALGQRLVLLRDRAQIARSVVEAASSVLNIPLCAVLLADAEKRMLVRLAHTAGDSAPSLPLLSLDSDRGITIAAYRSGETIYVPDVSTDPRFIPTSFPTRSELCVPLRARGAVIGILNAESEQPGAFGIAEIQLLEGLANEAAIALENARLLEEAEQRAQEFQALYRISLELANLADLSMLLDTVVQQTMQLSNVSAGFVYLYDGRRGDLRSAAPSEALLPFPPRIPMGSGIVGQVAATTQPLIVEDYRTWEGRETGVGDSAIRAVACVPMVYAGELVGVLGVWERPDTLRSFGEADLRLLTLVAGQVAGVVHNSRLLEKTTRRADQLAVLNELGHEMMRLSDARALMDAVTAGLVERLGYYSASVFTISDEGLVLTAGRRADGLALPVGAVVPSGAGMVGYVAETGRSLLAADVSRESRYRFYEGLPDARSEAVVPIVSGGSLVGVLDVQSEHIGGLEESDLQVLETLAVGAGRALENARLFGETHQRLRELEAVNRVSTALRVAQTLDEMLPILLDETLRALDAGVGSIALYEPSANGLRQVVARGWMRVPAARVAHAGQGLLGLTYSGGQPLVSREFAVDSRGSEPLWSPVPPGWGGVLVPVRTAQGIIGILTVAVQLPREVQQHEVRLLVTLAEIAGNAIHRTRLHEQTQQNVQRLLALHTVDMAISASVDLGVTLSVLLEQVTSLLHVDYVDILVLDPTTQSLEVAAGLGVARVFRQARPLKLGEGIAGRAAAEARTIVLWDLDAEAARAGEEGSPRGIAPRDWAGDSQIAALLAEGFGSYCAVPVVAKGQVKGVLEVLSRSVLAPDQAWLDFLQALCAQAAIAIDSSALFSGLQRSNLDLSMAYDTTLEGWARALELRDRETEGHTQRVADLTVRLARAMGMPEAELVHLRRGALLHDIGKMGVPDSVLLKPGPLTEEEWAIMRQHPTHAYQLLSPITFLKPALDVPYCHHEKWDGSGYPRGLKAEQIPLSARIFAIVDVWDALRSDRPYRKAWSAQRARDYIRDQSGTHFDPAVVDAFLAMRLEAQA